jgi:hypothetical protein
MSSGEVCSEPSGPFGAFDIEILFGQIEVFENGIRLGEKPELEIGTFDPADRDLFPRGDKKAKV